MWLKGLLLHSNFDYELLRLPDSGYDWTTGKTCSSYSPNPTSDAYVDLYCTCPFKFAFFIGIMTFFTIRHLIFMHFQDDDYRIMFDGTPEERRSRFTLFEVW